MLEDTLRYALEAHNLCNLGGSPAVYAPEFAPAPRLRWCGERLEIDLGRRRPLLTIREGTLAVSDPGFLLKEQILEDCPLLQGIAHYLRRERTMHRYLHSTSHPCTIEAATRLIDETVLVANHINRGR